MGGSPDYVQRDGQLLTVWMLYVITLLDADLFRAFGVHVIVTSAIRTRARQEQIFRERYVTAGDIRGRRVYDTRVWNGVRWYRISAAGTVAVPGTSNHEIQGEKAAVDIRDTGADAGITVASSRRGRWIRQWCRDRGLLIASGDGFGEGWHFDVPGIFRTPPAAPASGASKPTGKIPASIAKEIHDMDKAVIVHLSAGKQTTWALIGATIPGGVRTTNNQATANAWARIYGSSKAVKTKADWDVTFREARALHASWLAQQKQIHG